MKFDPATGEFSTNLVGRSTKDANLATDGKALTRRRRNIERMLKNKHGTVANMEMLFERLRILAMGQPVRMTLEDGTETVYLRPDPSFMKIYLDRVIGPVRNDEQVEAGVEKRLAEMLSLAEREARKRSDAIDVKPLETDASREET